MSTEESAKHEKESSVEKDHLQLEVQRLTGEVAALSTEVDALKRLNLLTVITQSKNEKTPESGRKRVGSESRTDEVIAGDPQQKAITTVPAMMQYSKKMSRYLQGKAVTQVVTYMKHGAKTSNDYEHLLRGLIRQSAEKYEFKDSLNPRETFVLRSLLHLTDGELKEMKRFLNAQIGRDVFSSRESVGKWRKAIAETSNYAVKSEIRTKQLKNGKETIVRTVQVQIVDMVKALSTRLTDLSDNERLIFDDSTKGKFVSIHTGLFDCSDDIVVSLLGDKGSDETKLAISIQNTEHPNSPYGLLVVAVYEGQDSAKELEANAFDVFRQWNALDSIKFMTKNGPVQKNVRKQLIGDMKYLSGVLGHQGQGCAYPCYVCPLRWPTQGEGRCTLGSADFSQTVVNRTLADYQKHAETGEFGVIHQSHNLVSIEPEDIVIPTIHVVMGIETHYFDNYLNGYANKLDLKNDAIEETVKKQRKEFNALTKREKQEKEILDEYSAASEDAYTSVAAYQLIGRSHLLHLKKPFRLCDAQLCIVNHQPKSRKMDEWIQCYTCNRDYHFVCSSIFAPEEKHRLRQFSAHWECKECAGFSVEDYKNEARKIMLKLQEEVQKRTRIMYELSEERRNLENALLKSTGKKKKELEMCLIEIGCDPRTLFQKHTGNQIRKILRIENINKLMDLFPNNPRHATVRRAMIGLSTIMSLSSNAVFTEPESDEIEKSILQFLDDMKMAFPDESLTPKLHLLANHLIPYLRKHHSWGRTSEQGIEHLHVVYNEHKRTFQAVKNDEERTRHILGELMIQNWLFDNGYLL